MLRARPRSADRFRQKNTPPDSFCGWKSLSLSGLSAAIRGVARLFDFRLCGSAPQIAAQSVPKILSHYITAVFSCQSLFSPRPQKISFDEFVFHSRGDMGRLPRVLICSAQNYLPFLSNMPVDFTYLKLYIEKVIRSTAGISRRGADGVPFHSDGP